MRCGEGLGKRSYRFFFDYLDRCLFAVQGVDNRAYRELRMKILKAVGEDRSRYVFPTLLVS